MNAIISLCLLLSLLSLMVVGECSELPGGVIKSVVGEGSTGPDSGQPVFTYPQGSFRAGDPSNFVVPQVSRPASPQQPATPETENDVNNSMTGPQIAFTMTSDVAGAGSFTMRNFLEGQGNENKAYQLMSAKYGNLNQTRELSFSRDSQSVDMDNETGTLNYALTKIDIQDSIGFFGLSYSDISKFKNNNDFIQDENRAGALSRTSTYRSQSLKVNEDDDVQSELLNNYIVYNINTKFVGSSNLHTTTNGTEIMQSYIGQIAMQRGIASQLRFNHTMSEDSMLECCPVPSVNELAEIYR